MSSETIHKKIPLSVKEKIEQLAKVKGNSFAREIDFALAEHIKNNLHLLSNN